MRKFIVWNVFGYSAGNVRLLAVYHFTQRKAADEHAARVKGGHVLKSHQEREPRATEHVAEGDTLAVATEPENVKVAEQPADTAPLPRRHRAEGWTF